MVTVYRENNSLLCRLSLLVQKERVARKSKNSVRRKMWCLSMLKAVQALYSEIVCSCGKSAVALVTVFGSGLFGRAERSLGTRSAMACHCLFSLLREGERAEVAPLEYYNFSIPKGGYTASTFFHLQPSPEKRECCFDVPD